MRRLLAGLQHHWKLYLALYYFYIFFIFFGGLECVGHSFVYVAHFVFLRDVLIRTQRAAVASRRYQLSHSSPSNLATHLPPVSHPSPSTLPISLNLATHLPQLSHPSPSSQPPISLAQPPIALNLAIHFPHSCSVTEVYDQENSLWRRWLRGKCTTRKCI